MKYAYLAILPIILGGCSAVKAHPEMYLDEEIDATSQATSAWLKKAGHKDFLLTGNRSEDCQDDHSIIGHGVIVKQKLHDGSSFAISGVVCVLFDGMRTLQLDSPNGQ